MANTRARWAESVPDLYGSLEEVDKYLNAARVSAATGLSVNTIEDALSRPPITNSTNVLGPLSRPARRIGNSPLWSQEQVDEAVERQRANGPRHLGGGDAQLPVIDSELSDQNGYLSTAEIAEITYMSRSLLRGWRPVHEQTIRRFARDYEDFPPAVALRARSEGHAGVPIVVYDGEAIREWLRSRAPKIRVQEREEPTQARTG